MIPTQTYTDNSRGEVVLKEPCAMHTIQMHGKLKKKKMSNPLKTHQNTLVSHPAPKLPSASNSFDVLRSMN